ncbi:metallophosphoesterase family protein [Novosphingobium sp. SL115]|uniref:metallophosphoesterase family protein n=1 Tax=Novosphingobium sp. SL115 TaxID=2995150 RepID=UPI002273EB6F|nr:metallophosphoesterase family protein [Novosphingobium sp. SL115]MCY1669466.1 metallophosphoesterase family protein [Novosphingobium sp. SL115]
MLQKLRALFATDTQQISLPSVPHGERVYAIGDVHGRRDLLCSLVQKIELDDAARGAARTTIVFLGDLIDRGPDSAGVIADILDLSHRRAVRVLAGNHEEMLLAALESEAVLRRFLEYGGRETVVSYMGDLEAYRLLTMTELTQLLPALLPVAHLAFLRNLEDQIRIGDYLFVHAGIRPGVRLPDQRPADLRWIRGGFLDSDENFGAMVIHGHTISEHVEMRSNRIGIDTGAYLHGKLTAIGLDGTERWFLEAQG